MTDIAHWDAYRAAYPTMTYLEAVKQHRYVWKHHRDQFHQSAEMMDLFFEGLFTRTLVLEVGGWRGEAAKRTLANWPDIKGWLNFEICDLAVQSPVTKDPRYHPIWLDRWVWETPAPVVNVAVLSHVIEHVSDKQLPHLLGWVAQSKANHIYIESPISEDGQDWTGNNSAHVLTLGWKRVIDLLESYNFAVMARHTAPSGHPVVFASRR